MIKGITRLDRVSDKHNKPSVENVQATLAEARGVANERGYKKCIVIFLDDEDGNYTTQFLNAGLSASNIVALMEVMKARFLRLMGYLSGPGDDE